MHAATRDTHSFYTAPSCGLLASILGLCSSPAVGAGHASTIARELADAHLRNPPGELAQSDSALEKALEASALVADVLDFAQQQLTSLADGSVAPHCFTALLTAEASPHESGVCRAASQPSDQPSHPLKARDSPIGGDAAPSLRVGHVWHLAGHREDLVLVDACVRGSPCRIDQSCCCRLKSHWAL